MQEYFEIMKQHLESEDYPVEQAENVLELLTDLLFEYHGTKILFVLTGKPIDMYLQRLFTKDGHELNCMSEKSYPDLIEDEVYYDEDVFTTDAADMFLDGHYENIYVEDEEMLEAILWDEDMLLDKLVELGVLTQVDDYDDAAHGLHMLTECYELKTDKND